MTTYIRTIGIVLLFLLFISIEVKAQESISLNECKQKALEHNQAIKVKKANYTSSEASLKLSKRASLPNFDFNAQYLYQSDPLQMSIPGYELPTIEGKPSGVYSPGGTTNLSYHNTYNVNAGASLPLYLGGKLSQSRKIASYAKEIAESDIVLSETDVILSIEQQYWSLVSLLEQEKVTAKAILFLNDVVSDMNNRYEAGIVTKNEVLKTKVELNNTKLVQITIHNNIELSKMALNQSIGEGINNSLHIADTEIEILEEVGLVDSKQYNLNNREEVKILTNLIEIYESERKIINADYLPQLVSFANYSYKNPNYLSQDKGGLAFVAGVNLSIPIFHWGARGLKNKKARMKIASAQYELDHTKELLTLEINQSIFRLKESVVKLQFTAEALEQAEENLNLENNRLEEELSTTTDLLNAQMQWQKAQSDYIFAKANVKISEAIYKKSIGELTF